MRKSLLFLAAAALSTAAFAQEIPTGDVCIQSVTHPTYWFNQGWSWGTQVALKTQPKVYTITANGDGTYKLSSTTDASKMTAASGPTATMATQLRSKSQNPVTITFCLQKTTL